MANLLAFLVIIIISYWIMMIISRKKRELADKELLQKEQFLKETQSFLKTEVTSVTSFPKPKMEQSTSHQDFQHQVSEYFSTQGYSISKVSKAEGIDLIGVKEKELLLIRSENVLKEIKKLDLQLFIAACSVYVDHNPMLKNRSLIRVYATNRPIMEEALKFMRENPASLRLMEEI